MIALAAKDTMLVLLDDHGYPVCLWRGELPVGCSEAPPATMLLSNSLYLDVVPQMMAGIIMNRIIERRRSGP